MHYYQQLFEHQSNNKKNLKDNRMDNQKQLMKYTHNQSHRRPNDHQHHYHYHRRRHHHTSRRLLHRKNCQKHFRLCQKFRYQLVGYPKIYLQQFVKHFHHYGFGQLYMHLWYYQNIRHHHINHHHSQLDLHPRQLHQHRHRRQQLLLQRIRNLDQCEYQKHHHRLYHYLYLFRHH